MAFEMNLQVKKTKIPMDRFMEEAGSRSIQTVCWESREVKQYVACAPDHEELFMPSWRDELYPLRMGDT